MRMMKTNKIYIAAATLALSLAACSEQADFTQADVVNAAVESADAPVQFSTYLGEARSNTRSYAGGYAGGSITNDGTHKLKTVGFGVFGYYSGNQTFKAWSGWDLTANPKVEATKAPNFMYNEHMTWDATLSNWKYAPVKYWPNGVDAANAADDPSNTATEDNTGAADPALKQLKLNFFAYAPYVEIDDAYVPGTSGALPTSPAVTSAKNTTEASGIVAMSANSDMHDMQLKYKFGTSAQEDAAVDMLWGLRGQKTYQETDADNNSITTLGSEYNVDLTKQIVNEKVKFLFKHALARVGGNTSTTTSASGSQICGLKVVVDVDKNSSEAGVGQSAQQTYFEPDFSKEKTLVTIKKIKIRDMHTYSQETTNDMAETRSDFLTEGWFDIMRGEWTKGESNSTTHANGLTYSITVTPTGEGTDYTLNDKIKEVATDITNSTGADWSESNRSTHEGVEVSPAKNVFVADEDVPGLVLIPADGNNTLYITVDYVVRTADSKLNPTGTATASEVKAYTEVEQEITNKVVLDGSILEPNKFYTLVMHLGMTSVKFEAVVADWATSTDEYSESGGETTPGDETPTSVWLPSNVVAAASPSVAAGSSLTVDVASNTASAKVRITGLTEGDFTSSNTTYLANGTVSAGEASSGKEFTLNIGANLTNQPVVKTLTITNDGKTTTITINQAADDTFTLAAGSPANISKDGATGGVITIATKAGDSPVKASSVTGSGTGITVIPASPVDSHVPSVTVTASAANSGSEDIQHTVTLTISGSDSKTYTYTTTIGQVH